MWALPFGAAAGDERMKRGEDNGTFWRAAWGVSCDCGCCDRREAGEDMITPSTLLLL